MNPDTVTQFEEIIIDADDSPDVSPGDYPVQLVDVKQKESRAGNPMLIWETRIAEGEYAGTELTIFTVTTASGLWKAKETAKAFGLLVKNDEGKSQIQINEDAIGRVAMGTVEDDEYNGEVRPTLKTVYEHPDGFDAELSDLPF